MIGEPPALDVLAREWGRIGCLGFGGPPAHIALLRDLCVVRRRWIAADEFEDAIAATNLVPGPSSTQLAIYSAWRVRGTSGALVGGLAFVVPGLIAILTLAALFLAASPPRIVLAAGAGAGAAVAAVALHAAAGLAPPSWQRTRNRLRWVAYVVTGVVAAATFGAWVVGVLLACGLVEIALDRGRRFATVEPGLLAATAGTAAGGSLALAWVALKVGALSFGGGFVIVPLMQHDATERYGWMSGGQFLTAVALGQITPGPVVHTVAAVGYAAGGLVGGLLAAFVVFAPSFVLIIGAARRFDSLRGHRSVQAFFAGAGPAAIGAIAGAAIPLALALEETWQIAILAAAGVTLIVRRRSVVATLVAALLCGVLAAAVGAPIPR